MFIEKLSTWRKRHIVKKIWNEELKSRSPLKLSTYQFLLSNNWFQVVAGCIPVATGELEDFKINLRMPEHMQMSNQEWLAQYGKENEENNIRANVAYHKIMGKIFGPKYETERQKQDKELGRD